MPQQGLGTVSRQDILLPAGSQPDGATVLFIYSGEVRCNFFSDSNNTLTDQLQILLDPGITDEGQIVGFQLPPPHPPLPIVLPTSWNSQGDKTVIGINSPLIKVNAGTDASFLAGQGVYIFATISVQNGQLLNAQYQVSIRAKFP